MRTILLIISMTFGQLSFANPCEKAHKKAVNACSAYKHSIDADSLDNIGDATKKRMAERESLKLFSQGRACAKSQRACVRTCDRALNGLDASLDLAHFIELQNDCSQGTVAKHRSKLAKQYLGMKELAESTRDPASGNR